jgi:hypothetical protein
MQRLYRGVSCCLQPRLTPGGALKRQHINTRRLLNKLCHGHTAKGGAKIQNHVLIRHLCHRRKRQPLALTQIDFGSSLPLR